MVPLYHCFSKCEDHEGMESIVVGVELGREINFKIRPKYLKHSWMMLFFFASPSVKSVYIFLSIAFVVGGLFRLCPMVVMLSQAKQIMSIGIKYDNPFYFKVLAPSIFMSWFGCSNTHESMVVCLIERRFYSML